MERLRAVGAMLVLGAALSGCGSADDAGSESSDVTQDRWAMPSAIVDWEDARGWGNHHIMWHTERRWDRMTPDNVTWAKQQGWTRAKVQEGQAGNGLEFLAMHRAMLGMLREAFPSNASLFHGWTKVPTNPRDKSTPLPNGDTTPFDADMLKALDTLTHDLDQFKSDDDFGLYLETKLRPIAGDPGHKSDDPSAGIHNYMHNRFMDEGSAIDVGDPSVNLRNKIFWRLHGWIDARWTAFRKAKGLADDDPTYQAALANAEKELSMKMGGGLKGTAGGGSKPPDSLVQMFESGD